MEAWGIEAGDREHATDAADGDDSGAAGDQSFW